jgi:hypothetical protein
MSAAWRASEGPQERSLAQEDLVDHEASMGSETEGEEGNMNEGRRRHSCRGERKNV